MTPTLPEQTEEKNRLKRAWIWFWYNNTTRFLLILFPSYFAVVIPALMYLGIEGEALRHTTSFIYLMGILWAMLDNDYSNLERIGLTVDRRPLRKKEAQPA
jgi:hypothetical protein